MGVIDRVDDVADNRLWISDIDSVSASVLADNGIDFNLNLAFKSVSDCMESSDVEFCQIPFRDGRSGREVQEKFNEAVTVVLERLRCTDDCVLVNCSKGVSRSAAVVACAVAVFEDISFEQGLECVECARPVVDPYKSFRRYGEAYVKYRTDCRWL